MQDLELFRILRTNNNLKMTIMSKLKNVLLAGALLSALFALQGCNKENNNNSLTPAVVTIIPTENEGFVMQLTDDITLFPTNLKKAPYGQKEVRAQVLYEVVSGSYQSGKADVNVSYIDSIRTKLPVNDAGSKNDLLYGNDPIEIVRDWRTVAEDGYLTLRLRTYWGRTSRPHIINLVVNAENPYELELRHNAQGDVNGQMADALIAFNLNKLLEGKPKTKLKLSWQSYTGKKSLEFDLAPRGELPLSDQPETLSSLCPVE